MTDRGFKRIIYYTDTRTRVFIGVCIAGASVHLNR